MFYDEVLEYVLYLLDAGKYYRVHAVIARSQHSNHFVSTLKKVYGIFRLTDS